MRRLDSVIVLAVVGVWLLPWGPTARAGGPSGVLSEPQLHNGVIATTLSLQGLPAGAQIDRSHVQATVAGRQAEVQVTEAGALTVGGRPSRGVVIVMDTSGSMAGAGITASRTAAAAFLRAVPADVRVGLVTFSERARLVRPLTSDRVVVQRDVSLVTAHGETALYDGVVVALQAVSASTERRLVVLSDGEDTRSGTPLGSLLAQLRASGTTVDVVGFRTSAHQNDVLGQLAQASGGRVSAAGDAAGLSRAFGSTASQLATRLGLQITMPSGVQGRAPIEVTVPSSAGVLVSRSVVTVPGAPSAVDGYAGPPAAPGLPAGLGVALGALFVGLLGLSLVALQRAPAGGGRGRGFGQLLARYTLQAEPAAAAPAGSGGETAVVRTAVELGERVVRARGIEERLRGQLERAGYSLKPGEWVVLQVALLSGTFAVLVLLGSGPLRSLGLALLVGWLGPRVWLRRAARRRQAAFLAELPDALQLLAGSLASGYSLPQALDALANEGRPPVSAEVGRALAESRLGVDIEDSLDAVAARLDIPEFQWVVMAVRVQREVGGNLANVLGTVAATLRDRERLRRQVRALSAEGRLSGLILVCLPIAVGAFFFFFENSYVRVMYTSTAGILMSLTSATLVVLGWLWMRKLAVVEV